MWAYTCVYIYSTKSIIVVAQADNQIKCQTIFFYKLLVTKGSTINSGPADVKVLQFLTRKSNLRGHFRGGRRLRTQKMWLQTYHNPAEPDSWFSTRTAQQYSTCHPERHIQNEWCCTSIGNGSTTTSCWCKLHRFTHVLKLWCSRKKQMKFLAT